MSWQQFGIFFFNDTATTEIYTLSLHDALPISYFHVVCNEIMANWVGKGNIHRLGKIYYPLSFGSFKKSRYLEIGRDTSELQSRQYLVCRLLLEKKKTVVHRHLPSRSAEHTSVR